MKNTTYLAIFLICNFIQLAYFINEPVQNTKIQGDSTVSIRIGMTPVPITNTPTPGPSSTPTLTPTMTTTPYPSATPRTLARLLSPTSTIYRISSISPTIVPAVPTKPEEIVSDVYKATIFGVTSPKSKVQLSNPDIFIETTSDEKGDFIFSNQSLPKSSPEICLETKDNMGRTSSPVCLPPIPTNYVANIGPIIMPPTISLNQATIYIGDKAKLAGQSIPDSTVEISMYTDEKNDKLALFPPVYARVGPRTVVKTDGSGNFSINIPTQDNSKIKTFAQVYYDEKPSDKSPVLSIDIYMNWMIIIVSIQKLINLLMTNLLALTFLIEVIIATILFMRYFFHQKKTKKVKYVAAKQL